ncbi:MAG: aspartate aminotransferase family protein, partial [Chitinophagaceae bacterium]
AGYTLLKSLQEKPSLIEELNKKTKILSTELAEVFKLKSIPYQINQIGSMMSIFFTKDIVVNFECVKKSNSELFNKFFHQMLNQGIYIPPSSFESWFLNNALSEEDIEYTIQATKKTLDNL